MESGLGLRNYRDSSTQAGENILASNRGSENPHASGGALCATHVGYHEALMRTESGAPKIDVSRMYVHVPDASVTRVPSNMGFGEAGRGELKRSMSAA